MSDHGRWYNRSRGLGVADELKGGCVLTQAKHFHDLT